MLHILVTCGLSCCKQWYVFWAPSGMSLPTQDTSLIWCPVLQYVPRHCIQRHIELMTDGHFSNLAKSLPYSLCRMNPAHPKVYIRPRHTSAHLLVIHFPQLLFSKHLVLSTGFRLGTQNALLTRCPYRVSQCTFLVWLPDPHVVLHFKIRVYTELP